MAIKIVERLHLFPFSLEPILPFTIYIYIFYYKYDFKVLLSVMQYPSETFANLSHPNIIMHILHTVLHTFP